MEERDTFFEIGIGVDFSAFGRPADGCTPIRVVSED